jgi:hypothetical protein
MTPDQKCEATEPRGAQCADELLIASAKAVAFGSAFGSAVEDRVHNSPPADPGTARALHQNSCQGSDTYADAVFDCWDSTGCDAFAACVTERDP